MNTSSGWPSLDEKGPMPKYQIRQNPTPPTAPASAAADKAAVQQLQQKLQNLLQNNPALLKKAAAIIEDMLAETKNPPR